jgi:DNA invertase Pin-like site-specific DNA recombinase
MKAIIYARVSTNDQDTTRQINDLKKYATVNNLNVVEVFQDKISGFSKSFNERDSWNDMFSYIESSKLEYPSTISSSLPDLSGTNRETKR